MGSSQSSQKAPLPPCKGGQEAAKEGSSDACPVPPEHRQPVYNVYNQRIDGSMNPKNNMPAVANQELAPGQRQLLSTTREQSSIPKGGTDATWLYPSPQMFYNGAQSSCEAFCLPPDPVLSAMRQAQGSANRSLKLLAPPSGWAA